MGGVWMVARVELRRRWTSLAAVGVLAALVTAVVLTALVGAQRTATSVDRFREHLGASDAAFQSDGFERADAMVAALQDMDGVELATQRLLVNAFLEDGAIPDIAVMSDPAGLYGTEIDRPLVLEGRLPAADAPDEILLNEMAAEATGLGVGDHLELITWSSDDLEALFSAPSFPGFNGPPLDLEVVGVGRVPDELAGDVRRTAPFAIGSPDFVSAHPGLGAWPPAVMARLEAGTDVATITEELRAVRDLADAGDPAGPGGFFPDAVTADDVYLDAAHQTVDALAVGLLVFAGAALLAGGLAVAQAVRRSLAGASNPPEALRALGFTRSRLAAAHTLPVVVAGAVAVLVGALVSVAASPVLPLGLARRAEVDPGVWFDPVLVVVGSAALLALLAVGAFLAARRHSGEAPASSRRRQTVLAGTAARLGARPTTVVGVGLAGDRGQGSAAVPLRSTRVGVGLAVAGVMAAGVIALSYADLEDTPADWGWVWTSAPDYFGDGDVAELEARLVEDDRIEAVANWMVDTVVIDDRGVTTFALEPLRGSMAPTSVDGRLPVAPGEVAMGDATLHDLGAEIGDRVTAMRPDGSEVPLTIVGVVVLPPTDEYATDVGAVLTPEGLAAAGSGDLLSTVTLTYPDGADVAALEAALTEDYGLTFNLFTRPNPPGSVRNLVQARSISAGLALFFVAIGAIGLLHALVVSTRRRRVDLAVLRALGVRRGQVRRSVAVAAVVLAVAGALVGVPVGLVVGRVAWRALVDGAGAVTPPATPWLLLVVVMPVVALVALLSAWAPARAAARVRPAEGLRSE